MKTLVFTFPFVAAIVTWLYTLLMLYVVKRKMPIVIQNALIQYLPEYIASRISIIGIANHVSSEENLKLLHPLIEQHIDHLLRVRLEQKIPMISMLLGDKAIDKVKSAVIEELDEALPKLVKKLGSHLQETIDVSSIIRKELEKISINDILTNAKPIINKSVNYIQIASLLIGFFTGLVLMIMTLLITQS